MALLTSLEKLASGSGTQPSWPRWSHRSMTVAPISSMTAVRRTLLPPGWARSATWLLRLLLVLFGFSTPHIHGQGFHEYELKAAFLYNFAQFVDWPPEAFPSADTPLVIGILGADPFGAALDTLIRNEVVKNRKLEARRYRQIEDVGRCHILFISASETARFDQILAVLKGKPILTVGDSASFAFRGGMIRLLTDKNKIRLRINMEAAKAANLTISSKLLRAADVVGNDELGRRL